MEVHSTVISLRGLLDPARGRGRRVGMVGTSGAMHRGHLSLIERAAAENDLTVLYWGGNAAFDWMSSRIDYARDASRDLDLAQRAGCDVVFVPSNDEFFPRPPLTKVSLPSMSSAVPHLESPDHLDLIAMVMCRLWNMVGPCRYYSGEKDWQQLTMFARLAEDLYFPVEVLACPTVREADGLAVSSRNSKLTVGEREQAAVLYAALCACRDAISAGDRAARRIEEVFTDAIGEAAEVGYVTMVEADTMRPLAVAAGTVRLLASVTLGRVRLIDNVGVEAAA